MNDSALAETVRGDRPVDETLHEVACNAAFIEAEIAWFRDVVELRLTMHASIEAARDLVTLVAPPPLPHHAELYPDMLRRFALRPAERLVLMLAYVLHLRPGILDPFLIQNQSVQRRFTEFGGYVGNVHGGFLPTAETALFLLAGEDIAARLRWSALFSADHLFQSARILLLDCQPAFKIDPVLASNLTPSGHESWR